MRTFVMLEGGGWALIPTPFGREGSLLKTNNIFIPETMSSLLHPSFSLQKVPHIHVYSFPEFTPPFSTDTCVRVTGHSETNAPNDPKMTLNAERSHVPV